MSEMPPPNEALGSQAAFDELDRRKKENAALMDARDAEVRAQLAAQQSGEQANETEPAVADTPESDQAAA